MAVSFVGGARRDVERLRVQDPGSPGWATNRVATTGVEAEDGATWVDSNAAVSSAASDVSDTETVREREEPLPQASRTAVGWWWLLSQAAVLLPPPPPPRAPLLSPGRLGSSSGPSALMLFRRPRCRSRSIPRHISSVTPKRSRQRRS
jgi:hypothetical protein